MTRRISLIIGLAVIVLTGAVPATFGAGRYPGSQERSDFWNYESNVKVADSSPGVAPQDLAELFAGSARELGTNSAKGVSHDIVDLLVAKNGVVESSVVDALNATSGSPEVSTVDVSTVESGMEIEWRQVGVGFAIGILLMLSLGLATRIAHVRPFAH